MPLPSSASRDFITGLPKAELHVHIEGTLEPELKIALAARNGIELDHKTVDEVRASYSFDSLASFLAVYYPAMEVLVTEQDFYDLARAYLERAAADGVKRAEIFFDPQAHTSRGVRFDDVVRGYHRATLEAGELGIDAKLIMCFLRDHSQQSAAETLEASIPFQHMILGVGLDSDEAGNPPSKFADVFARARELGYLLTMHCDVDQADTHENLRQVINDIGVDRIDHGSNVLDRPDLVDAVRDHGLGLTCCPLSNGFVTGDLKAAEIAELLRSGVKVTINSDDPAYFGGYVADNYIALAEAANLSTDEVVKLARNSFEASWVSPEDKTRYLTMVDRFVESYSGS